MSKTKLTATEIIVLEVIESLLRAKKVTPSVLLKRIPELTQYREVIMPNVRIPQFKVSIAVESGRPVELRVFAPDRETAAAFALNSQEAKVELLGEKPLAVQVTQVKDID